MHTALTKSDVAALAASRGRPVSAVLAAAIATLTGGCPRSVDVALDAATRAEPDVAVTRAVSDAVFENRVAALRSLSESAQTVVLLAHLGGGSDPEVVTELVGSGPDVVSATDDAVAAGLLSTTLESLPEVERALHSVVGTRRVQSTATELLEYRCKTDTLDLGTAVTLASNGIRHPELATYLTVAASAAEPERAVRLYEHAVAAGADAVSVAPARAENCFLLGDLDAAEDLADSALAHHDSIDVADVRVAVRVSAAVAAERGMLTRAAQLYTWLGPQRTGVDADLAIAAALVAGNSAAAEALAASDAAGPPTAAGARATLLAEGLRQSIRATSTPEVSLATSTLLQATAMSSGTTRRASPDSAAAVAALFALHTGDLARADATARRAVDAYPAAHPHWARLVLLRAWASMLAGDTADAQAHLDSVRIPLSHTRNRLFEAGLRVGLARRSGDTGALLTAWDDALDVVASYSVDLLSFLPVGELLLAAVRLGQPERVAHLTAQADAVLADLHEPHAWSSSLHWYGVQAAILAEHPADLVPHARALAQAAESNRYAAALAGAGRAWLGVLQGSPNVADVEAAAQSLTRYGLSWDGARLASEAALRVADTRVATSLLQTARSLRLPTAAPTTDETAEPKGSLSAREAEVAELLVLGVTYREAGARLYISAKTVEHHVARIRRRLGAGSRSELLSMLRALGYGAGSPDL